MYSPARMISGSCSTTRTVLPSLLQGLEDLDEAVVVPGVEADRRLVEHEHRPHERGAERGGQVDPLGLAAAQGEGHPVERDVVESHLEQEPQPALDLGDELLGDLPLERLELEVAEERRRLADRQPGDVADRPALDLDAHGVGVQARPAAGRAGDVFPVAAQEDPDLDLVFLGLEPVEKARGALVLSAALPDEALLLGGQPLVRHVRRDAVARRLLQELPTPPARDPPGPGLDRALLQAEALVRDDLVVIKDGQVAEPVAVGAGALRAVEGEHIGEGLFVLGAVVLALELLREQEFPAVGGSDPDPAAPLLEPHLQGIDEPLPVRGVEPELVDEDLDLALLGEAGRFQLDHPVVLDDPEEAFLAQDGGPFFERPGEA